MHPLFHTEFEDGSLHIGIIYMLFHKDQKQAFNCFFLDVYLIWAHGKKFCQGDIKDYNNFKVSFASLQMGDVLKTKL